MTNDEWTKTVGPVRESRLSVGSPFLVFLSSFFPLVLMTVPQSSQRADHQMSLLGSTTDGFTGTDRSKWLNSAVSERFTREAIDSWLQGTEKSRRVLLSLCHDLVVTQEKDRNHVSVRGNVMGFPGAVEQWTLHLKVDAAVRLEAVDVRELYKAGTFYYPLVQ